MSWKKGFRCLGLCLYGIRELASGNIRNRIWDLEWTSLLPGAWREQVVRVTMIKLPC